MPSAPPNGKSKSCSFPRSLPTSEEQGPCSVKMMLGGWGGAAEADGPQALSHLLPPAHKGPRKQPCPGADGTSTLGWAGRAATEVWRHLGKCTCISFYLEKPRRVVYIDFHPQCLPKEDARFVVHISRLKYSHLCPQKQEFHGFIWEFSLWSWGPVFYLLFCSQPDISVVESSKFRGSSGKRRRTMSCSSPLRP